MTGEDTRWVPELASTGGSWAARLANAIAADVASGRLSAGTRLPTQRALAQQLGVTTGTVNRGYAIAERAGLVAAEVGRGTFVTASTAVGIHDAGLAREATGAIDLALNYPAGREAEQALAMLLPRLIERDSGRGELGLAPYAGRPEDRAAGARWLGRFGLSVTGEDVLLCTSVQHGLAATLAAITAPGDVVLTESLTSPGMKTLAALHHLRLVGVECDEDGLAPTALANACRVTSARVLYTMPTLHTPTTTTMPLERRQAIANVIQQHGLVAIEDDAWGFLAAGSVVPLHALAVDHVVYLTSFSKSLAPGLRVGYVVAPSSVRGAITACIGATTWTAPLLARVVSRWIDDGTAASIVKQRIRTASERRLLAEAKLGPAVVPSALPSYHVWLPLPEPWRVEDFVSHASALGVSLAPTDSFVPGRAPTPHAIRVCTGTESDVHRIEEGLQVIARLLESGPKGYSVSGIGPLR
jgi:DNA-binding transcriptional MocR family regulator